MKMSIIDHRPIQRITWYKRVRSRSHCVWPVCAETSIAVSPTIFSIGTATLAKNTNAASGYIRV